MRGKTLCGFHWAFRILWQLIKHCLVSTFTSITNLDHFKIIFGASCISLNVQCTLSWSHYRNLKFQAHSEKACITHVPCAGEEHSKLKWMIFCLKNRRPPVKFSSPWDNITSFKQRLWFLCGAHMIHCRLLYWRNTCSYFLKVAVIIRSFLSEIVSFCYHLVLY